MRLGYEREVGRYHKHGRDTEVLAAQRVMPRSGTQRWAVLNYLRSVGNRGATDYETWSALAGLCAYPHVAGTRREELMKGGWDIYDSGIRRLTGTGSSAIVWVLVEPEQLELPVL